MEGSWQAKCSSPRPPTLPILQFPESRNQVRLGVGQYLHPCSVQHGCTNEHAVREGATMFDTQNLGPSMFNSKSGNPDSGNYFLALLSAYPQQFQCEIPGPSGSRPPMNACTLPTLENSVAGKASSSTVQGPSSMTWLPQPQGRECIRNEAEPYTVSLRDLSSVSCGRATLLHDTAQTGNSVFHGLVSSRQVSHHAAFNYGSSFKESDLCWPGVTNAFSKLQHIKDIADHDVVKKTLESQYSLPVSASASLRGYPRVFCLGTSGVLLISDTGHLGIICLCHNLHMSVSNFCEHSGSCAADPGDSVRMESGETLGQWRKHYFPKLGIKVQDDGSGWDWPDWSMGTSGSSELKSSYMQNTAKDPCPRQDIGLFGRKGRSGQPCSELISFTNPLSEQATIENFADCFGHDAQQRNAYGDHDVAKNLIGGSHAAVHTFVNNQNILSFGDIRAEPLKNSFGKEAQEDGYQSVAECVGIIHKSGNPCAIQPSFESLRSFTNDSSGNRLHNSAQDLFLFPDVLSSNFELRLGQPSEQSHICDGSAAPLKSQALDVVTEPKISPYVQLQQRDLQQSLPWSGEESVANKETDKESEMYHMTYGFRNINADKLGMTNKLGDNTLRGSSMSMFYPQIGYHGTHEDNILSEDTDRLVSSTEQLMAGLLGADHQADKCTFGDCQKCNIVAAGLSNQIGNGRSSAAGTNSSSNSLSMSCLEAKFHGITGGNCVHVGTNSHAGQSSCLTNSLYFAYDPKTSSQVGLSSTVGCHDPSVTLGSALLSSPSLVNCAFRNQICLSNLKSNSQKEESIHLTQHKCDENPRLCALRNMVGMSMHDYEIASHDFCQDDGLLYRRMAMQMQRNEDKEDVVRMKLNHGAFLPAKRDTSDASLRSLHTCSGHCLGGGCPCCFAGAKNAWNLVMPQEIAFHSQEVDAQSRSCCCNHGHHEQPRLRLGRKTHDYADNSDEHVHYHQNETNTSLTGKFSCFGRLRCLTGNCCSRLEIPSGSFHECNDHEHVVSRSSCLHGPLVDRRSYASNGELSRNIQHESLVRCDPLKFECQSHHWAEASGPSRVNSGTTSIEMPAEIVNAEGEVECVLQNTFVKGSAGAPTESLLNEQQMSNVCSEGSAPAITEFSISSGDACTDGENARFKVNSIVDEESGIKKSISSSDATDTERLRETTSLVRKVHSVFPVPSTYAGRSSHNFSGEAKLTNSIRLNKLKTRVPCCSVLLESIANGFKMEKKERTSKLKQIGSPLHTSEPIGSKCDSHQCNSSFHNIDDPLQVDEQESTLGSLFAYGQSNLKRKRSALSYTTTVNKRFVDGSEHEREYVYDAQQRGEEGIKSGLPKILSGKKAMPNHKKDVQDQNLVLYGAMNGVHIQKVSKRSSNGLSRHLGICHEKHRIYQKERPTVTGNSGIITNGRLSEGFPKPLKFGSLSLILKTAKRCTIAAVEPAKFSVKSRMAYNEKSNGCNKKVSMWWTNEYIDGHLQSFDIDGNPSKSVTKGELNTTMVRKRSLCELTKKDKETNEPNKRASLSNLNGNANLEIVKGTSQVGISSHKCNMQDTGPSSENVCYKKNRKWVYQSTLRSSVKLNNEGDIHHHVDETCQQNYTRSSKGIKHKKSVFDDDALCCVCRNNDVDNCNRLLECESCLIRVHQACYGVLNLPKGCWCCRPCRAGSKNIVCVLCGYQGGAMTRALKSQKIVKRLLQAWKVGKKVKPMTAVSLSEIKADEMDITNCTLMTEGHGKRESSVNEIMETCMKSLDASKRKNFVHGGKSNCGTSGSPSDDFHSKSTITDFLLDPTVKQWVHMVCGLWMPGTRCPNVDTMGAFDVSGVACLKRNKVCSMCRRPGGSCIKCRVAGCTMMFHPWCAHQKGLLQSEIEGDHNENIGFYGKCIIHSRNGRCQTACTNSVKIEVPVERDENPLKTDKFTCGRSEGYKGRKKEEGSMPNNVHGRSHEGSGCLVPQEQVNAWLHINGQKSCAKLPVKSFLASDIEHDSRKEYSRYKQAKGWKNLVVYKSGIHALGLYTSQFIPRGAMVVEYVGEIVGSRVADKREIEYLSGRGVQYKSACYFFRIDKEHIIDATRKGGIARFVNHSCLPNCVAKIITIRNEKKVVFFAERDINPGEEITYDYHFNHEDEGKKIPCFCNSKNCRRFLN